MSFSHITVDNTNYTNVETLPHSPTYSRCCLSISEQENFMHRIFDVVHIGVSFSSFESLIQRYSLIHNLSELLNSRMKNDKYSESFDYPLCKTLVESCGIGHDRQEFLEIKLKMIQYLVNLGANPKTLTKNYMGHPIDLSFLLMTGSIDKNIFNLVEKYFSKE
jgi:hypothetical protein